MPIDNDDCQFMARALEIAARGQGIVEPNPMVGCVIVRDGRKLGDGWHTRFGGPHAEIEAIRSAGDCAGATMYVSLEPCCHEGKTGPCTQAVIGAGIRRVVIAQRDPFEQVAGHGIEQLQAAGIEVEVGFMEEEARYLNAPYLKLAEHHRPWIIAKWAMTLDGKIASAAGDSRWISCESSRALVHELRGRVDAIMVGSTTAAVDDPQLTARPPGTRTATRIVVDGRASLSPASHLVRTAHETPVLVATGEAAPDESTQVLANAGCDVFSCAGATHGDRLASLLDEMGRRRMTNVLVEGGGGLIGNLLDLGEIDEVHAFVAIKLIGGAAAPSPAAGQGIAEMAKALRLERPRIDLVENDIHVHGRTKQRRG